MARLLVIEDDAEIGGALQAALERHGHHVAVVATGAAGLRTAAGDPLDLIVLDLGLPDLDGVEVCRRLRSTLPTVVIVMLTARSREMDVVVGLEVGADDYLTKPVSSSELVARIQAHLRRTEPSHTSWRSRSLGALVVDVASRRVTVGGEEVQLRRKEFDLLTRLVAEPGVAVTRETLMADVWDEHWHGSTKTLDVHVASLRRKLASVGADAPRIVTLRGHGYRLEADPTAARDQ